MSLKIADNTIERCENRLSFLSNKINESSKTIQAVHDASDHTKKLLENHITQVKDMFNRVLQNTYENLCDTVDKTVEKDLQYLQQIEEYLLNDTEKVKKLIEEAKSLKEESSSDVINHINHTLADISKSNSELPILSLSFCPKIDEFALTLVEEKASDLIKLNMTGSLQIVECVERPGAIIVRWDEQQASDTESINTDASMLTEYMLQICDNTEEIFTTIYEGDDLQYTMNFAEPNKMYSFRVCQYLTGGSNGTSGVYGPWSMIKKVCTTLAPHVWRESDCMTESDLQLYQLSNGERTATKVFPESSRILRSKDATYLLGQQLTFWVEEMGESSINDGIGFISQDKQIYKHLTQSEHAAVLNTRGGIFVNGSPMVTKLPALKKNSVVVFNAVKQSSCKLRMSITIDDKEVTFDWSTTTIGNNALYFACGFEHTGWKLSVG